MKDQIIQILREYHEPKRDPKINIEHYKKYLMKHYGQKHVWKFNVPVMDYGHGYMQYFDKIKCYIYSIDETIAQKGNDVLWIKVKYCGGGTVADDYNGRVPEKVELNRFRNRENIETMLEKRFDQLRKYFGLQKTVINVVVKQSFKNI